jgi:acyl-CoA thioester hydrolase
MSAVPIYRTGVAPEWIDYNGHLRDAYYSLIVSLATDALMDRIGLDEAYRYETDNTLYTLEMHIHYLREIKKADTVEVAVRILATDAKRIHAALDLYCAGVAAPAASAEVMLLHVHQGDSVTTAPFPAHVVNALHELSAASGGSKTAGTSTGTTAGTTEASPPIPGSRRIELRSRS